MRDFNAQTPCIPSPSVEQLRIFHGAAICQIVPAARFFRQSIPEKSLTFRGFPDVLTSGRSGGLIADLADGTALALIEKRDK